MRVLDENILSPGDIVLTSAPSKASRMIRRASRSNFSHAMLYVASGSVIHSNLDGVHAENPIRMGCCRFRGHRPKLLKLPQTVPDLRTPMWNAGA